MSPSAVFSVIGPINEFVDLDCCLLTLTFKCLNVDDLYFVSRGNSSTDSFSLSADADFEEAVFFGLGL